MLGGSDVIHAFGLDAVKRHHDPGGSGPLSAASAACLAVDYKERPGGAHLRERRGNPLCDGLYGCVRDSEDFQYCVFEGVAMISRMAVNRINVRYQLSLLEYYG